MAQTAAQVLVVGGLANLLFGLITGGLVARVRTAAPDVPKYLHSLHLGTLMWAPILLGLVWAVHYSHLTPWVETLASGLVVGASVAIDARDLLYWVQGTKDEFVERPPAFVLGPLSAAAVAAGTIIFLVGVLQAL
jgi:hypothetical protein